MSNKGSLFRTGEYLRQGDYLQSANGCYCAYLHDDGNLCVYSSPTPDASTNTWCSGTPVSIGAKCVYLHEDGNLCIYNSEWPDAKTNTWCSGTPVSIGKKCLCLHDDGNLCIYNSEWPDGKTNTWCSGSADPIVDIEIYSIDYSLDEAKILHTGSVELYNQGVINSTSHEQTSTITGSEIVSETSSWSDALSVKVGVETEFQTGIPFVAEGKVKVSAEVCDQFTWNGSITREKEWGFIVPVTVNPHETVVVLVVVGKSTIVVPYTLNGTFVLRSGRKVVGQKIKGIYTGTCSHDITVNYIQQDSSTAEILYKSVRL